MRRAVARGQTRKEARPIAYIGVDEKAFRKGHQYHTIVRRFCTRWHGWAVRSRLEPVKGVAATDTTQFGLTAPLQHTR
jgi:hypothetical protein